MSTSPLEQYLKYLDGLTGNAEPEFFDITDKQLIPQLVVIVYRDIPEPGDITGFTFGLSNMYKPEWVNSKPELIISVRSLDLAWPLAMGDVILRECNQSLFGIGTIYNFQEQISEDSTMSSFCLFTPSLLDSEDMRVKLTDRKICLSQMYPIYEEEGELISEVGPLQFFRTPRYDLSDVRRQPILKL